MNFFNPSGGLTYHYLAARYKNTLWLNYQKSLSNWLKSWNPHERNIILIGASGGYNLSDQFLRKFDSVKIYDPDRLAPWFFKRNHPMVKFVWSHEDILGVSDGQVADLTNFFSKMNDCAVLFCNVIGQLPLLLQKNKIQKIKQQKNNPEKKSNIPMTESEIENFMKNLSDEIYKLSEDIGHNISEKTDHNISHISCESSLSNKKRSVASFHDLYSRNLKPEQNHVLRDHMTQSLFHADYWQKENLIWPLTPAEEHQIECVYRK